MSMKEAYRKKMEAQLSEWSAKLDVLKAKAEKASAEGEVKFQEQIDDIETKKEQATKKLQQLSEAGEETWEQFRGEVDHAWDEMKTAIEDFGNKIG